MQIVATFCLNMGLEKYFESKLWIAGISIKT
jgi:hypothetical protein